jgi:hypothetical protein
MNVVVAVRRLVLLLAASLIILESQPAHAQRAGTVEFVIGQVTAQSSDGAVRNLVRHGEVRSGDRISTRTDGRTQIRFADGAFVSLVPESEFVVRNYRFEGKADGNETAFLSLLRGTMRAVSGLIGKANASRFEIQTPTATLGIRGTAGVIQVDADGTTRLNATSGIWVMRNAAGSIDVPAGTSGGTTPDITIPPRRIAALGIGGPAQQRADRGSRNDGRDGGGPDRGDADQQRPAGGTTSAGGQTLPPPPIVDTTLLSQTTGGGGGGGATGTFASATLMKTPTYNESHQFNVVNAMFDAANAVTDITIPGTVPTPHAVSSLSTTTMYEVGQHNSELYWGRWTGTFQTTVGGTLQSATLNPNEGLHFLVANPTAPTSMPIGVINYTHIGGTNPTFSNGVLSPGTFIAGASNPMMVDFTTGKISFNFSLNWTASQTAVSPLIVNVNTGPLASSPIALSPTAGGLNPLFSGTLGPGNVGMVSSGGTLGAMTCTPPGCTANVWGAIAGPSANSVGIIYKVVEQISGQTITGTAAYKQ